MGLNKSLLAAIIAMGSTLALWRKLAISLLTSSGLGVSTFTRSNATGTITDNLGNAVCLPADVPRFDGMRPIINQIPYSEDFSNAAWVKASVNTTLGISDPLGGSTACTVTATAGGATFINNGATASPAGAPKTNQLWVRRRTGTGQVQILNAGYSGWDVILPTSTWKKFSRPSAGGSKYSVGVQLATSGDAVDIAFGQGENQLTGRIAQAPSEYQATTANPVSTWSDLENPNNSNYIRTDVRSIGVVSGLQRWACNTPFLNGADYATDRYIDVLLPDTYTTTKKYRVVYVAEVEAFDTSVFGDSLQIIKALGLHNSNDVIFARQQFAFPPWYGARHDGLIQNGVQFTDVLVKTVDYNYSTVASKEGRGILGFSKSGWGAVSLLLRRDDVFGYAGVWDAPWSVAYGDFNTASEFGTSGNFNLYNPTTILAGLASRIKDKTRIYLAGSALFDADTVSFDSQLTSNAVPHVYSRTVVASDQHAWGGSWLTSTVAGLLGIMPSSPVVVPFSGTGLLIEQARTQYLGVTSAPATQTTGSLGTGTYTFSVVGSGSALVAGVGATISGAASATEASPNTFTVSVAGSVLVTVTGSLTFFQLENGAYKSSRIDNPGAAGSNVARSADVESMPTTGNVLAASSTIYMEFTPRHAPSGTIALWGTYVDASNYTALLHDATNLILRKRIAGTNYDATIAMAFISGTTYKVAGSWGAGGVKVFKTGVKGTDHANTAAAQIASNMQLGADGNGAQQPFACIKNQKTYLVQLPDATVVSMCS